MKVKVLFFAGLREELGTAAEEIELPSEVSTVAALRRHLVQRGGPWQKALGEAKLVRVAVNKDMSEGVSRIKPGDEVAFFPPVTGG